MYNEHEHDPDLRMNNFFIETSQDSAITIIGFQQYIIIAR